MLRWLPREIAYRKERGWATPMGQWVKNELRPLLAEALLSEDGLCRQVMSEAELQRLIADHASGRENRTRELPWVRRYRPPTGPRLDQNARRS
jgi:asparagine synthetase B (glutamine-hydrolysing)